MISEKPLENYCDEVCLVFFYAQPLSSYMNLIGKVTRSICGGCALPLVPRPESVLATVS